MLFKLSVNIAFTPVFPLKKQYLCTFEYFIQIKTSGKTHCKLFHHHFCLNIRFFMYFRLGASLLPVKMAAIQETGLTGKFAMAPYHKLIPMFFPIFPENLVLLTESEQFGPKSAHICPTIYISIIFM